MKKHLFPRGLVQNIARDLVSLSSVNRELTNSKTIIIVIWYLCFADNLLKHSFCFLTLVHIRKASITVCDQTYAEMRAYTNFRIQGTGFCICPRAKTVQGYKETWSYSDDQHLEAKFCPLVTTWTLGIAFCAYGLWANLAWESPYSEVFPWVRKPVNVTWSEILQKHKQDLSWNTRNWIQTCELHWTASYKRPLPGCISCLPKAQRKPYRWCCQCRINMPAFWQPQIMQMHVIFIGTYSKTLN